MAATPVGGGRAEVGARGGGRRRRIGRRRGEVGHGGSNRSRAGSD
jgi:hypothetical protein